MENNKNIGNRPNNPRRKKRTKEQIIKEDYLPLVIAGLAVIMIFIFIIGSITRGIQRAVVNRNNKIEASIAASIAKEELDAKVEVLLKQAETMAIGFDYEGAVNLLESIGEKTAEYPVVTDRIQQYNASLSEMVQWDDNSKIPNLSFQQLIADPSRAFRDAKYGSSLNANFITTEEFAKVIQQLYDNNYILVSLDDITDGVKPIPLMLPKDKKPIILTETQVNCYTYLTDSDNDNLPDAGGSGFASKLILDANGNITCEMVTASGETVTGAFDAVPILEAFIQTHPDFSYKGARAILAVTGYDGVFGYRTTGEAEIRMTVAEYEKEVEEATKITKALRDAGYELACYTYDNAAYGSYNIEKLEFDLEQWNVEVSPILGVVRTLVYAKNSDIAANDVIYSGEKYEMLSQYGFTHYLGFAKGTPWSDAQANYFRQGRILLSGSNLAHKADWFSGMLNPGAILDPTRGAIPS